VKRIKLHRPGGGTAECPWNRVFCRAGWVVAYPLFFHFFHSVAHPPHFVKRKGTFCEMQMKRKEVVSE
jgi:hypothetical protein